MNEISSYHYDGMEIPFDDWTDTRHTFADLASAIQTTHDAALGSAVKAINRMQTMRNWLIGYYIVEFEQHGQDWAEYGTRLLKKLEERVDRKGLNVTLFKNARSFYQSYPQMAENIGPASRLQQADGPEKSPTASDQFRTPGFP